MIIMPDQPLQRSPKVDQGVDHPFCFMKQDLTNVINLINLRWGLNYWGRFIKMITFL